jgi:PAS domain S-box-containing protein
MLRASERRFRDMADTAPVLMWVSGPDKLCTWFNRPWLDFVGRSMEQEVGDGWAENVHPGDLLSCVRTYETSFDARKSFSMEYRLRRHDGVYRWVLDNGTPLYESGRFTGYIGSCVDITDRKEAETALRDREAEMELVARTTPVALTRCSRDLRYLYINQAGANILGLTPEQVIGRPVRDVMNAEAFAVVQPHIERVLGGETVEYEEEIPYVAGSRWMRVTYVPDVAANGDVAGWIGSIVDITERKRAELDIARLYDALQESDRRKDEFLAILAHELRNPLAPVRNATQYLKLRQLEDPEVRRPIELIDRQVSQMTRLIEDLLDISRISRGTLELRRAPVQMADLVQTAVDACRHEIDGRGHALRMSVPVEPLTIHGDRARLVQALCNLIGNAVKFSRSGDPIEIGARASDGHLLISVRDHGAGIPPENLEKVFELFVQLDRSLERQGGLGVGLTLTRQIVELHGGTIEARSEGRGHGSEFVVRLPIGVVPEPEPSEAAVKTNGPSRRILVVDDNADTVDSLATVLEFSGHRVDKAFDGIAAYDATARLLPDVVLLDIGMPKMNGYDVARRIREQPWGERIHLVALTGWGQQEDKRRAREAGFDAHLVKPIDAAALERVLADLTA